MSDSMWAPWRMDYIVSPKPSGCVFCNAWTAMPEGAGENLVLAVRDSCFVIMNRFPYSHGHIMVVPARHVSRLDDLSGEERAVLFELLVSAQTVLTETLGCQGLNIGMNLGKVAGAGIEDHLHIHIVPRWEGDTNFMPVLADVRVMPEHLRSTYDQLLAKFEKCNEVR